MTDSIRFRKLSDRYFDAADRAAECADHDTADRCWKVAAIFAVKADSVLDQPAA
jgi:hypothetical protein